MKCSVYISVFLFGLGALISSSDAQDCKRAFTDPPPDCTTKSSPITLEDVTCLVYVNGNSEGLEFPQENTRTCYRTCHTAGNDSTLPTCQASLTSTTHNKDIPVVPAGDNATEQILFSPNYNKNKDYRKSTICRYDVTCDPDHILGYMFNEHILENSTDECSGAQNKCVDYVKLTFPNVTDSVWLCGQDAEVNKLFVDGHSAISVEFYANRYEETTGFNLAVMCYEPGAVPSKRKRQAEDEQARTECRRVSDERNDPVDSVQELRVAIASETIEEDLKAKAKCEIIINELDTLHYHDRTLSITRRKGREEPVEGSFAELYVSNRFRKSRRFEGSADIPLQGYAELCLSGPRAYLNQLGINPIFKPTRDETKEIVRLQRSITSALECYYFFDVFDKQDAEEEGVEYVPSVCKTNFKRDRRLDELAIKYGNACNEFLRFVACSYQAAIMNIDCETGDKLDHPIFPTLGDSDDCLTDELGAETTIKPANTQPADNKGTKPVPSRRRCAKVATTTPSLATEQTEDRITPVTTDPTTPTERTEDHTIPVTTDPTGPSRQQSRS